VAQDEPPQYARPATASADLVIEGGRTLCRGPVSIRVPGDKSISHRALLAALLPGAPRELTVRNANLGGAVRALLPALAALGLRTELRDGALIVEPNAVPVPQPVRPHPEVRDWPAGVPYLETEGSSAAARLLIGVLAGAGVRAVVDGDEVLRHRPMEWLVDPLRALGARIGYLGTPGRLPIFVHGPVCHEGTVDLAVGSAQSRSAVLLAAVAAGVPVTLHQQVRSRDHTERMLAHFGADLEVTAAGTRFLGGGCTVPETLEVPGDPSLAAYPVAAHLLWGNGELAVRGICLNPTRLGFFEVLRRAGADIRYQYRRTVGGERVGSVLVRGGLHTAGPIRVTERSLLHALIDEVPLVAAVAARLPGTSWIGCAEELRFKETDRLETTAQMCAAFGARVAVHKNGLTITGGTPLRAGPIPSFEDHRVAMAAATLAAALPGRTTVLGGGCHRTSFPDFVAVLHAIGARIREDIP
jgi:3-phosphoshikimate 1-carboxyvinyltransferase